MAGRVTTAFEPVLLRLPFTQILPLRPFRPETKSTSKYQRIVASIRELGMIEPLVVHRQPAKAGGYLLLDGHLRMQVLQDNGETQALCLISTDDEAFTYNHKVNQVSPIQEHFMIMKALEHGVPEERIAATLNVDIVSIRRKRDLLAGICPEAVMLLKDRPASAAAVRELRRVAPMRQIEMAELMRASGNYTTPYAKCLVAATHQEQMIESEKPKQVEGVKPEDLARMEREMESLGREFRGIEDTYGKNVLNLVLAVGYLRRMLDSEPVARFLTERHREIAEEFRKLVETADIKGGGA